MLEKFNIEELHFILNILKENKYKARLVGGCVRDAYLGIEFKDIDIATDAKPDELIKLFPPQITVKKLGYNYGSILAILNKKTFEITTLRQDVETDGRYAKVTFTKDFYEDAKRRDFTINALSLDLEENKIYDYFSGIEDLKSKKVKFIGNAKSRIKEDYLRILRFFRFSAKYADQIDPSGLKASVLNKDNLKKISIKMKNKEILFTCTDGWLFDEDDDRTFVKIEYLGE
jgi:poly(A) polymerase